jgi:preprotein translocase subunit SecE
MKLLELGTGRMAKSDKESPFWRAMLSVGIYKRNQGKLSRQLTAAAILAAVVLSAWSLSVTLLADLEPPLRLGIPIALGAIGAWFAYRIVNYPVFADFLVDVEGEMLKVSWPSRDELVRATVVVLVVGALLSAVLFSYDVIWQQVLRWIRVLQF